MPDTPPPPGDAHYLFGPFRLQPTKRLLMQGEQAVPLGSRSLDVLAALVERAGEVLTKRELMNRAWPNMVVGEGSLKVAVMELRRVLGDDLEARRYLVNVPARGYMFVAPVTVQRPTQTPEPATGVAAWSNLPSLPTCPIGREDAVAAIIEALHQQRLVSIVGPGGIGKTTVAIVAAHSIAPTLEGGACFVDLGAVADGRFVPAAVAQALGVVVRSEDALTAVAMALRDRRMLVVLDNCEGLLDAVAALVGRIVGSAPGMRLLATSREAVRVAGEAVHRLAPLGLPPQGEALTPTEILLYPAVRLFIDRATIRDDRFEATEADVPVIADICRKLEGLPLAIELTATRVDAFSLPELAALLDDRLRLLQFHWRGSEPRHASLSATLDWSYELLNDDERTLLQRLSVFAGDFSLGTASAVAGDDIDVAGALEGLVAKSLLASSIDGQARRTGRYRLLDTTRAYAAAKLGEGAERDALRSRHAHLMLQDDAHGLADVRSALAWASSPDGPPEMAVALTIAALPLWTRRSLLVECRDAVERTLADARLQPHIGPRERMALQAALGMALLHTRGPQPETASLWHQALATADELQDVEHQLRLLWGLPLYLHFAGDYRGALGYLRRFRAVARAQGDAVDQLNGERLLGTTLMFLGRLPSARTKTQCMLRGLDPRLRPAHIARFQFEPLSIARGTLANILWLQGEVREAMAMAQTAVDDALQAEHPLSLLTALGHCAVPLALHTGDRKAAERYLTLLADLLARNDLALFGEHAHCLQSIALLQRGDLAGVSLLEAGVRRLLAAGFHLRRTHYLCELARGQAQAGRQGDALATIDEALAWCDQGGERWYMPEALRLKGELLGASPWLDRALQMAQSQGAWSWALRAAISRVRLRPEGQEAMETLRTIHGGFDPVFTTADLEEARKLLA